MHQKGKGMRFRLLLLMLAVWGIQKAWCVNFAMDTWIITLEPDNKKTSQVLTLKYVGGEMPGQPAVPLARTLQPVPVELSIYPRTIDLEGRVHYDTTKASPEFVIYPSQLILYPGDVQKVQVQWVSDKPLTREIAYGLIASQLPVNLESNAQGQKGVQAQLVVLTRYEGIVDVRPKNAKPLIVVDTVFSRSDSSGKTMMIMQLQNKGTGLQVVRDMRMTIAPLDDKGHVILEKRVNYQPQLNAEVVRHALFSGQKRRFTVAWPSNIPVGPVQVTPEFP
jgi:fimbrial chaperone protein